MGVNCSNLGRSATVFLVGATCDDAVEIDISDSRVLTIYFDYFLLNGTWCYNTQVIACRVIGSSRTGN